MEFALRSYDKINVDSCKDVTHLWSTLQAVQLLSLLPLFWWEWVMDEHSDIRAYTFKNAYYTIWCVTASAYVLFVLSHWSATCVVLYSFSRLLCWAMT